LHGRGVANLEDALVNLELQPVHEALRHLLEPAVVRALAAQAEEMAAATQKKSRNAAREGFEFAAEAWERGELFLRAAQKAYLARVSEKERAAATEKAVNPVLLAGAFRDRLRAALRLPGLEGLFEKPWTAAARRVLPSASPERPATALWGPVLGWCALELLAESIDVERTGHAALDVFDRLRLREPFAEAFGALGLEDEAGWLAAARIKVALLAEAGVGKAESAVEEPGVAADSAASAEEKKTAEAATETGAGGAKAKQEAADEAVKAAVAEKSAAVAAAAVKANAKQAAETAAAAGKAEVLEPEAAGEGATEAAAADEERVALAPGLWLDPDVRWLCGVHEAEGHTYLVREKYEELLWWLMLPELIRMGAAKTPERDRAAEMGRTLGEALATAEEAGYRIDVLLGLDESAGGEDAAGGAAGEPAEKAGI
jgi:hypothetical protein